MLRAFLITAAGVIFAFAIFLLGETRLSDTFNKCVNTTGRQLAADKRGDSSKESPGDVGTALECSGEFVEANNGAFTAIATILLTVVTGGLVVVAAIQIRDTRALQRAHISVEPGGIRPFDSAADSRVACDVILVNAGNLPAQEVRWAIAHMYSTNSKENGFYPDDLRLIEHGIVLTPKGQARKGSDPTTKAKLARARDGAEPSKAWLYVYGRVTYHDGFRASRKIDFVHRYNLHGGSGFTIPAENGRFHEFGNRIY